MTSIRAPFLAMTLRSRRALGGCVALVVACVGLVVGLRAETGYDLWLRYPRLTDADQRASYRQSATAIVVPQQSPTAEVIAAEIGRALRGLLGVDVPRVSQPGTDGAVIVGTPSTSSLIAALGWTDALARVGDEGYVIRSTTVGGRAATVIASNGEAGALYGAFHWLRLLLISGIFPRRTSAGTTSLRRALFLGRSLRFRGIVANC